MESELWDGNFGRISLHGSLEHLPSDASCIKTSLIRMAKYIENKKIDTTKSNSVKELLENSFPPSTMQDGIRLSVTPTITPSDRRYHIIAPRRPPQSKVASLKSRIRPNRLVLREYPLPSLPRPLRKSTRFPSSSYIQINCSLILLFDTFGRLFHF